MAQSERTSCPCRSPLTGQFILLTGLKHALLYQILDLEPRKKSSTIVDKRRQHLTSFVGVLISKSNPYRHSVLSSVN
ncbi:hypothetical protein RU639_008256 [Aspergillus parasiticus]